MKLMHKKIISAILPIPLFFVITFCCCLKEDAFADDHSSNFSTAHHNESQELEKSHSEDQDHHSEGDHECSCPKHLSFLSAQSTDIAFDSSFNQMLAKNLMANLRLENIFLLASLSNHSQGPPLQDHRDYVSLPIYLKISNLRI